MFERILNNHETGRRSRGNIFPDSSSPISYSPGLRGGAALSSHSDRESPGYEKGSSAVRAVIAHNLFDLIETGILKHVLYIFRRECDFVE